MTKLRNIVHIHIKYVYHLIIILRSYYVLRNLSNTIVYRPIKLEPLDLRDISLSNLLAYCHHLMLPIMTYSPFDQLKSLMLRRHKSEIRTGDTISIKKIIRERILFYFQYVLVYLSTKSYLVLSMSYCFAIILIYCIIPRNSICLI